MAAKLAEELAISLSSGAGGDAKAGGGGSKRKSSKLMIDGGDGTHNNKDDNSRRIFPIPLPKSLRDAPRPTTTAISSSSSSLSLKDNGKNDSTTDADNKNTTTKETPSRTLHKSNPSHALTHATLATESILSSLSKIASGGSAASSEMRALENQRQQLDAEAIDLEHALAIREGCVRGGDSLMGRRYPDAARAVADVNAILEGSNNGGGRQQQQQHHHGSNKASERAKQLAGNDALSAHAKTVEVLKRAISERYETAVQNGDVSGLSELTPLLGMLDMAELGVKLYLQYSQSVLCQEMNLEVVDIASAVADAALDVSNMPREEGMSRAAMRRRAEEQARQKQNMSVPLKLARIYNAGVTHIRHHLPMVAYSLGEADGDAALVQLVHVEAEKRVVDILREYMAEQELGRTVRRAEMVASKMEERYAGNSSGGGGGSHDEMDNGLFGMENVILGLGSGGDASASYDIVSRRNAAQRDDCGFTIEVGNLSDVDAALEEWALVMQHTESYERFIRHAVMEVIKARKLRMEQKREERRRAREMMMEEAKNSSRDNSASGELSVDIDDELDKDSGEDKIEILPPHTALNEVAAEIGGYYSSLERCLLLAGMQRAFIHANFPDDSTYTPVAVGNSYTNHRNSGYHGMAAAGSHALQTNLIEECLFAARRSTLRAFATGHTGTASAAANVCVDVLGRVLLEVLTRRAELGASLVKPGGEGSLLEQSGLGQAALSFAGKGFRGVQGATARARAGRVGGDMNNEESAEALRQRTLLGVARAAANFNDLEVVADYTKRLEINFLKEIDAGYPQGHDTEQLRMCVKGLGGVVESFSHASRRSMEELISTVLPRVRQIVNDSVGQEGGGTGAAASNFLGSPVLNVGVGTNATVTSTFLTYNLDDNAFELSQISEGYVGRMCSNLDELIIEPLRVHLVPKLSDDFVIGILGGVSKRLEAAIRKSKFTPLGAISLDSDIRYLMNFAKDRIDSPELKSNVTLCKACPPLARLNQITLLMNVDDLEDALDLISVSKRKGNWDLKLDDAKTLLSLRVDFEGSKVNDLLQVDEE
ncbi:hypothetical protein ACHAXR_007442 [Thalassiosira sp. AJA248-18]